MVTTRSCAIRLGGFWKFCKNRRVGIFDFVSNGIAKSCLVTCMPFRLIHWIVLCFENLLSLLGLKFHESVWVSGQWSVSMSGRGDHRVGSWRKKNYTKARLQLFVKQNGHKRLWMGHSSLCSCPRESSADTQATLLCSHLLFLEKRRRSISNQLWPVRLFL